MITLEEAKKIYSEKNKNSKIIGCVLVDGFGFDFSTRPPYYGGPEKLVSEDGKYYELSVGFDDKNHPFNKAKRTVLIPVNL